MADVYNFTLSLRQYHPDLRKFLKGLYYASIELWRGDYTETDYINNFIDASGLKPEDVIKKSRNILSVEKNAKIILRHFIEPFNTENYVLLLQRNYYGSIDKDIVRIKDKILRQILSDLLFCYRLQRFDEITLFGTEQEVIQTGEGVYTLKLKLQCGIEEFYNPLAKIYHNYKYLPITAPIFFDLYDGGVVNTYDVIRTGDKININLEITNITEYVLGLIYTIFDSENYSIYNLFYQI